MTLLTDTRTALAAVLATTPGIGRVHDYFRLVTHDEDVVTLLHSGGRVHAWFVTLADDEVYSEDRKPGGCARVRLRFQVHGYYAVADADASEKAFTTVVQAVLDTLRTDRTLGGVVIEAGPASVKEFGHRTFVNVLCHYARVELGLWAQVTE